MPGWYYIPWVSFSKVWCFLVIISSKKKLNFVHFFAGIILYLSIPLLEMNEKFSIFLPNAMNFSFYMPTFLKLYLNFVLFPSKFINDDIFLLGKSIIKIFHFFLFHGVIVDINKSTFNSASYFLMSHMYRRRTKVLSIFKRKIHWIQKKKFNSIQLKFWWW